MKINEMIIKLSGLNTLFDYSSMWSNLKNGGIIGSLIIAGVIISLGVSSISILINTYSTEGREKGILAAQYPLLIKLLLLVTFILFYTIFCDLFLGIISAFTDHFFKSSLIEFRADFNFLISSISNRSDAKSSLFFPSMDATLEVFLFSVSINLIIVIFYIMLIFTPAFLIICLAVGPVILPFSLISKKLAITWGLFLIASGLFPSFVGIAIQILNSIGYLKMMALSGMTGKLIQTIFLAVSIAVYITLIPNIVGTLFGAKPLKQFSLVMGFITMIFGLFVTSVNIISQLTFIKKKGRGKN